MGLIFKTVAGIGVALLVGCGSPEKKAEADAGPKRYRAWCNTESRPLGEATTDHAVAKKQRADHEKRYPFHQCVIWATPLRKSGSAKD